MSDYFVAGGIFMWPLTLAGIGVAGIAIRKSIGIFVHADRPAVAHKTMLNLLIQLGIFSLFLGILSQAIGLFQALQAIEAIGEVSPALIFGGLKVSMIAPVYGLMIFMAAFIMWSILKYRADQLEAMEASQ
jgi:biopolymer transport protein ExbB/TolQ